MDCSTAGFPVLYHLLDFAQIHVHCVNDAIQLSQPLSPPSPPQSVQFSSVQSLSLVRLFVTPWTAAHQTSLSITSSQSLLKLMSIESVMPSNHLILCRPLLLPPQSFPAPGSFHMSQFFASGGLIIGVSTSASVLPMNIQD